MQKSKIISIAVVLIVLTVGFFVYAFLRGGNTKQDIAPRGTGAVSSSAAQIEKILEVKTNDDGGVWIAIRPINLQQGNTDWSFEISIDVHSGDLAGDLMQVAELTGGNKASYKPTVWEGDPPGGHHRKGILKFKPITPLPNSIALIIRGVGGINERKFAWNLK